MNRPDGRLIKLYLSAYFVGLLIVIILSHC